MASMLSFAIYSRCASSSMRVLQAIYGNTKFGRIAYVLELLAYGDDVLMSAAVRVVWMAAF